MTILFIGVNKGSEIFKRPVLFQEVQQDVADEGNV
jgi:hypothetical protein